MDTIKEGVYDQPKDTMGSQNALGDFEVNGKKISTSGENCIDNIRSLIAFLSNKTVIMLEEHSQPIINPPGSCKSMEEHPMRYFKPNKAKVS